jgi:hypothetical protein
LRLIERYRRVDANSLTFQVTIEDRRRGQAVDSRAGPAKSGDKANMVYEEDHEGGWALGMLANTRG